MTIVVSAKVPEGVVLAADGAATFLDDSGHTPVKLHNRAHRIFDLVKVWPIGAMAYGVGGIGSATVKALTNDLQRKLTSDPDYALDSGGYTVEEVASKAREFIFDDLYLKTYPSPMPSFLMGYRVCGYSANSSLPEIWEFTIHGDSCIGPYEIQSPAEMGVRWAGENKVLDRLLLGATGGVKEMMVARGFSERQVEDTYLGIIDNFRGACALPAMSIKEAIEISKSLVEFSTKVANSNVRPAATKESTEIAAITKDGGFQWILREHYYGDGLDGEIAGSA